AHAAVEVVDALLQPRDLGVDRALRLVVRRLLVLFEQPAQLLRARLELTGELGEVEQPLTVEQVLDIEDTLLLLANLVAEHGLVRADGGRGRTAHEALAGEGRPADRGADTGADVLEREADLLRRIRIFGELARE